MDAIIDDGPFLDLDARDDRPRSRTWPLPDPCLMAISKTEDESEQSPQSSSQNDTTELTKRLSESVSPRKNNRKNAWGNQSYSDLITQAIDSSPEKRLTLAQIYDWMVKNVPYFKDKGDATSSAGWKNSIRHNLSLHNRFMRVQNDQSGKSSYWVMNPDAKPGKSPRRRSGSVDGPGKADRKRGGRSKKNCSVPSPEDYTNHQSPLGSASSGLCRGSKKKCQSSDSTTATSPCSSTDSLSNLPDVDENATSHYILSTDSFTRPRSTSNVSTHSSVGRLTPIPGEELEDDMASLDNGMPFGRPRGSSAAEETASLVESMTLSRQAETINLDESLKFETNILSNGCGQNGYGTEVLRPHSDSFSSVQSGDSGYESPSYFTPSNLKTKQGLPQMHNMMPLPKAPPPYQGQIPSQGQFSPIIKQNANMLPRTQMQQTGTPTLMQQPDMHAPQAFYTQASKSQLQINQRGYVTSSLPHSRRLQHLPNSNGIFNNGSGLSNFYNLVGTDAQRNLTNMGDPNLSSVSLTSLKEERTSAALLSQKNGFNTTQSDPSVYSVPIVPMEQDNDQFPSDLTHLELHDFSDSLQLQQDLETIIRNEMGEGPLDFERSYDASSTVNSMTMSGHNWVH
eukprot:gene167-779_t